MTMTRTTRSALALLVTLAVGMLPLPHARAETPRQVPARPALCPPDLPMTMVCDRALGIALTPPAGWTLPPAGHFPPSSLVFWTARAGQPDATLHLVIAPLGLADRRDPSDPGASAAAAADAETQGMTAPVTATATVVAGVPAVLLQGTPGEPDFGQEILVAHDGLLYGIYTFDNARTAFTPAQQQAVASLRFIPRTGPLLPAGTPQPLVAALQDPCLALAQRAPAAPSTARVSPRLRLIPAVSPARGNDMVVVNVVGTGLRPGERVTLTTCWNTGDQASYTRYQVTALAPATAAGKTGTPIVLSVPSGTFATWTVRALAAETSTGRIVATTTRIGRERPLAQGLQIQPHSSYVTVGRTYPFRLYTHCGVGFAVDFDHVFWDVADTAWRGSYGNPPPGIGNPFQTGTMTRIDRDHARFDFSGSGNALPHFPGAHIHFTRHVGPKIVPGYCA